MYYHKRMTIEEAKKCVKKREDDVTNAAIEVMINSFDEQDEPMVGPFWYDPKNKEIYGHVVALAKDRPYYFSPSWKKNVKTGSALHKSIWEREFFRHKDKRFTGNYTLKPRGRVFEFENEGFKVFVGNWINDYPEAKEEILYVFQLPKDKTEFVIDEHWDIGHGWSSEF